MKKFISFSGGVESSTMCVLFGGSADAIFADTGFEHKEIYERIDLVETWCKNNHRKDFVIHKLKPQAQYKGEVYTKLPDLILAQKYYPSFQSRYCTRLFKIAPIDDFLSSFDEAELMIGLNADEREKRTGNHGNKPNIKYTYPLADNGLSRAACIEILKRFDLMPNFPPYMKRGGCIGCYYKSKKEYEAMALLAPDEFEIVERLENDIQDKRDIFFSIHQGVTMKQIREGVRNMIFKPEEIYPVVNDATQCGVFCNR